MSTAMDRRDLLRKSGAKPMEQMPMWYLGGIAVTDRALHEMSDSTFKVLRALMGVADEECKERALAYFEAKAQEERVQA